MVTEDCNCKVPAGHVKALRIAGGSAAGAWGSVRQGQWVMVPKRVVEANPEFWRVAGTPATKVPAVAESEQVDLMTLTKRELLALTAEAGINVPNKATKATLVSLLEA